MWYKINICYQINIFSSFGFSIPGQILLKLKRILPYGCERHIFHLCESPSELSERTIGERKNVKEANWGMPSGPQQASVDYHEIISNQSQAILPISNEFSGTCYNFQTGIK